VRVDLLRDDLTMSGLYDFGENCRGEVVLVGGRSGDVRDNLKVSNLARDGEQ
jgi:hypothetical protein